MNYFWSKSTGGFYTLSVHGTSIPADAVEITDSERLSLIDEERLGGTIQGDESGRPVVSYPPAKTPAQLKQEELAALAAAYKADTFQLQLNFLTATVNDGTTEAAKKTIILEDIAAVKAQYILDIAAINAKYA